MRSKMFAKPTCGAINQEFDINGNSCRNYKVSWYMWTETTNVSIPANSQSIKVDTSTKVKKKERKLKAKKQDESLP